MTDTATAWLLAAPVLLPFFTALFCLLLARALPAQRILGVAGTALTLAAAVILLVRVDAAGVLATQMGAWEAPLGITLVADRLSAIMVCISGIIGCAVAVFSARSIDAARLRRYYFALYNLLLMGINGAFLTGDLFNLFVWFEVMLMASFAMMFLGRRPRTVEGTTKYVVLNMLASFFFLSGLGILYGKAGNLNLNVIAERLAASNADPLILTSAALLLLAFGIKAGVFPLFFWLPASYPSTGFTSAAVFGGLLTKVGVYALFRVFGGAFAFLSGFTADLFLTVGVLTMVTGVLGAASQFHTRKILSFHIVSQIGYLVLGLGLFTQGAFAAAIFYTVHHILVKTNLFFAAGLIAATGRSEQLNKLGGLFRQRPFLAILFAIPALSLGGIPPFSGFFAKFLLIREAFRAEAFVAGAVALAVGILTLFSMTKIWLEAFWKDSPRQTPLPGYPRRQLLPIAALAILTVALGFTFGPAYEIAEEAARQLHQQGPASPAELVHSP